MRLITLALAAIAGCSFDLPEEVRPEPDGGVSFGYIHTSEFQLMHCTSGTPGSPTCPINKIPLDDLNVASIPGATIDFVSQPVGSGTYMNNLKLVPGSMGAYISHPLFVSVPADPGAQPFADTFDRFLDVTMNLPPGATETQQQIGGGTAAFVNFPPDNKLIIFFGAASVFQSTANVCKVPTQFESVARGPLNTNCGTCHRGQNPSATAALDLTGVDQPNAMMACNQTLLHLNLSNINQSSLFLTVTPGNASHPFTFGGNQTNFTNFRNAITPWAAAERDAP